MTSRYTNKPRYFYVTLPSTASRDEFTENKANSFKVRLPQRLELQGSHWQVALMAATLPDATDDIVDRLGYGDLSLPDTDKIAESLLESFPLFSIYTLTAKQNTMKRHRTVTIPPAAVRKWTGASGEAFMTSFVNYINNQYTALLSEASLENKMEPKGTLEDPSTKRKYVPRIYMETLGQQMQVVVDNTQLYIVSNPHPTLHIRTDLALKMGWIERDDRGTYQIGPNLLIEGNNGTINTIGPHLLTYIADLRSRRPTYKRLIYHATTKTIELSPAFNWRFTNLNVAYDALRGFPARTLMVYSDVAASSIVGGQITDLLREIPYNRQEKGDMTIEPIHLQFQKIRSNIIETIEVHISEQDDKLVTFDSKKGSSITLVFRNDIP